MSGFLAQLQQGSVLLSQAPIAIKGNADAQNWPATWDHDDILAQAADKKYVLECGSYTVRMCVSIHDHVVTKGHEVTWGLGADESDLKVWE